MIALRQVPSTGERTQHACNKVSQLLWYFEEYPFFEHSSNLSVTNSGEPPDGSELTARQVQLRP